MLTRGCMRHIRRVSAADLTRFLWPILHGFMCTCVAPACEAYQAPTHYGCGARDDWPEEVEQLYEALPHKKVANVVQIQRARHSRVCIDQPHFDQSVRNGSVPTVGKKHQKVRKAYVLERRLSALVHYPYFFAPVFPAKFPPAPRRKHMSCASPCPRYNHVQKSVENTLPARKRYWLGRGRVCSRAGIGVY
jgi:hypothetical protein